MIELFDCILYSYTLPCLDILALLSPLHMHMVLDITMTDKACLQQLVEKQKHLATSCGFTINYQNKQVSQVNVRCYKKLAPPNI